MTTKTWIAVTYSWTISGGFFRDRKDTTNRLLGLCSELKFSMAVVSTSATDASLRTSLDFDDFDGTTSKGPTLCCLKGNKVTLGIFALSSVEILAVARPLLGVVFSSLLSAGFSSNWCSATGDGGAEGCFSMLSLALVYTNLYTKSCYAVETSMRLKEAFLHLIRHLLV